LGMSYKPVVRFVLRGVGLVSALRNAVSAGRHTPYQRHRIVMNRPTMIMPNPITKL
jgi:hypothetical protein